MWCVYVWSVFVYVCVLENIHACASVPHGEMTIPKGQTLGLTESSRPKEWHVAQRAQPPGGVQMSQRDHIDGAHL